MEQFGAGSNYCCDVDCWKPEAGTGTGDARAGSCQKHHRYSHFPLGSSTRCHFNTSENYFVGVWAAM